MNAKKIIAIAAVSMVILVETGVLQAATEKLELFRKRLQEKYAAKEQELAQKVDEQKSQPVKVPITIGDTTLEDLLFLRNILPNIRMWMLIDGVTI